MTTRRTLALLALSLSVAAGCASAPAATDEAGTSSAAQAVEACPPGTFPSPTGECAPCLSGADCVPVVRGFGLDLLFPPIASFWQSSESPSPAPTPACGPNAAAGDGGACVCVPGYYAPSVGGGCAACPAGADCSQPGTTEEGMRAVSGWYRTPGGSFLRCLGRTQCEGSLPDADAAPPTPAPTPACGPNASAGDGGACVCVPGYYAPSVGGDCAACPAGADCSQPGTTEEGMRAASGWSRAPDGGFLRCLVPAQCP